MHDRVDFAVIGDPFLLAFALHEMEGKGPDGSGDKGDGVPDGGISEGGLLGDVLSRQGLGPDKIPKRTVPGLRIGHG